MSQTRGEGRSPSEKSGRVITTIDERRRRKEAREAEERAWAEQSGPVTTTHVEPRDAERLAAERMLVRRVGEKHWLLFEVRSGRLMVTGCACGFEADVEADCGYGDSVVRHLLSAPRESVRPKPVPKTPEEKREFSRAWDARYEEGQRRQREEREAKERGDE